MDLRRDECVDDLGHLGSVPRANGPPLHSRTKQSTTLPVSTAIRNPLPLQKEVGELGLVLARRLLGALALRDVGALRLGMSFDSMIPKPYRAPLRALYERGLAGERFTIGTVVARSGRLRSRTALSMSRLAVNA